MSGINEQVCNGRQHDDRAGEPAAVFEELGETDTQTEQDGAAERRLFQETLTGTQSKDPEQ